ncbi:MAG: bifunctional 5,10-methylenetetrahydrofolate dehydrogenase/5,10-methenyltetrahydrofolate cyclohydrolase [Candidatus Wildermuthbacteria bacterium]|nr:bifunctional 5,10-methylenetetrahydrofolate dehydrogenase/5,10-methenyltetrahydrofolate cyclohydrolase [Candidatus Wildermuthbacteria bacterium]
MAEILSGERIAKEILQQLKTEITPNTLGISVVQVGKNAVSDVYIQKKKKEAEGLGIRFFLYHFPETIAQKELQYGLEKILESSRTGGMIIQLPLPSHLPMQEILDLIPPSRDIDVLSSEAFGRFVLGNSSILPPTVAAVQSLLETYSIEVRGKHVVIVGAGRLVGLPLSIWFMQQKATVTIANRSTKNLAEITKQADILISGVGSAGLITGEMVKEGVVIIDAGTSVESGETTGDVDFESVEPKASFITPVPGGVGPLTVAHLFSNLFILPQAGGDE